VEAVLHVPEWRNAVNILVVSSCFAPAWSWGGQVRSLWAMCRSLVLAGARVRVVTTDADLRGRVEVARHRTEGGLDITTVPIVPALDGLGSRFALAPGLRRAVIERLADADLAVLQGVWTFALLAAPRACAARQTPYVVCPRGTLEALSLSEKPLRKRLYMRLAQRRALSGAAAIQFASEEERRASAAAVGDVPGFVCENAFELPPMAARDGDGLRSRLGLPPTAVLVGVFGRLHARKGFGVIVPALARCDRSVHLLAFGADEAGHGARVRRLATASGVGDRVHLMGHVEGEALSRAYASVDLLAAPSLGESFGNVVVEALGQGTEVLVSGRVPLATYLERRALGGVVPTLDPGDWARALEGWRSGARVFDREAAARAVRADFGLERKGPELLEHYRRIASSAGRLP
jgi:glycosyltransferase involved in cell wall biosynthesis